MSQTTLFMPLDARLADVLGLLDTLENDFGGAADIYKVAQQMDSDLDDLVPALNAASSLGLVEVVNGDVKITSDGRKFLSAKISERKRMLRDKIISIEPFRTAMELGRRSPFHIDELISELGRRGYHDAKDPNARDLLSILLAEWGVYAGILRRKGDEYVAL
ncbi:MAG: AAA-associated domain-containing protein [Thermocladium sp.]